MLFSRSVCFCVIAASFLVLPGLAQATTFRDGPPELTQPSTSVVQRNYDELMKRASTMAGNPNATTRHDKNAPRLKIAPNEIDRTARDVVNWTAEVGGASQAYKTGNEKLPRRPLVTYSERMAAESRGNVVVDPPQSLGTLPATYASAPYAEAPPPAAYPAPVIYGTEDMPSHAPQPSASSKKLQPLPFTYENINQRSGLTTPAIIRR